MFRGLIKYHHLPSVNQAHQLGQSAHRCWIYLNPEIKKMQNEVIFQLNQQGIKEALEGSLNSDHVFEVTLVFVLNTNFWRRDVSNLIKHVEDAIAESTGVNDALHMKVNTTKVFDKNAEMESISLVIKPFHYEEYPYELSKYLEVQNELSEPQQ